MTASGLHSDVARSNVIAPSVKKEFKPHRIVATVAVLIRNFSSAAAADSTQAWKNEIEAVARINQKRSSWVDPDELFSMAIAASWIFIAKNIPRQDLARIWIAQALKRR